MSVRELVFVTRNPNKLREAQSILAPIPVVQEPLELEEIQGDETAVSRRKIREAVRRVGRACFVEDTSLRFDALGGLPGPYVHYFLDRIGPEGLWTMLQGFPTKNAEAVVTIGFAELGREGSKGEEPVIELFTGRVRGEIVSPRGKAGFGWDVIFMPEGYSETFGEMSEKEKNAISHRGRAFMAFREFLMKSRG